MRWKRDITFGIGQFGIASQTSVATFRFVSRQTAFARSDKSFPVIVGITEIVHVSDANDLMGFGIRQIQNAIERMQRHVVAVRHPSRTANVQNVQELQ